MKALPLGTGCSSLEYRLDRVHYYDYKLCWLCSVHHHVIRICIVVPHRLAAILQRQRFFFVRALAIYKLHGLLQSFANVQSIRTEKNEIGGQLFNIIIPVDMSIKAERFFSSSLQFWFEKSQKKNLKFIYQGFFLSLFPFIFDDAARLSLVASFCVKYLKL